MKNKIILLPLIIVILASCGQSLTKEHYLSRFSGFIEKLELEYESLNSAQWESRENTFEQLAERDYKRFEDSFTEREREIANKLKGRFYGIKAKYEVLRVMKKIGDKVDEGKGLIEELINE